MISKIYLVPEDEFRAIIQSSNSFNAVLNKLNMSHNRGSNDIIRRRCAELNISYEHFHRPMGGYNPKKDLSEILIENSTYKSTSALKRRIIAAGLMEYKCAICGNTGEWLDKPLTLQLDHINGNPTDHRLENLRLLCPNCHTQTETYGSKRGTKSDK